MEQQDDLSSRELQALAKSWRSEYRDIFAKSLRSAQGKRERRNFNISEYESDAQKAIETQLAQAHHRAFVKKTVDICSLVKPFVHNKLPFGVAFAAITLLHDMRRSNFFPGIVRAEGSERQGIRVKVPLTLQRSLFVSFWVDVILGIIRHEKSPNWSHFITVVLKEHIFGLKSQAKSATITFASILQIIQDQEDNKSLQSIDVSSLICMNSNEQSHTHQPDNPKDSYGHLLVLASDIEFPALFAFLRALKRRESELAVIRLLFMFFEAELVSRYSNNHLLGGASHLHIKMRSRLALIQKTLLHTLYTFGPSVVTASDHDSVLRRVKSLSFLDKPFWRRNLQSNHKRSLKFCHALPENDLMTCVCAVVEHRVNRSDIWEIAIALLCHHTKSEYLRSFLEQTLSPLIRSFYELDERNTVRSSIHTNVPSKSIKALAAVLMLNLCNPNRGVRSAAYGCLRDLSFAYTDCLEMGTSSDAPLLFDYIDAKLLTSHFGAALLERVVFDASIDKRFIFPSSALLQCLNEKTWRSLTWKAIFYVDLCALKLLEGHVETVLASSPVHPELVPPPDVSSLLSLSSQPVSDFYMESSLLCMVSHSIKSVLSGIDNFSQKKKNIESLQLILKSADAQSETFANTIQRITSVRPPPDPDAFTLHISMAFVYNCLMRSDYRTYLSNFLCGDLAHLCACVDTSPEFKSHVMLSLVGSMLSSLRKLSNKLPFADFLTYLLEIPLESRVDEDVSETHIQETLMYASMCAELWSTGSKLDYLPSDKAMDFLGKVLLQEVLAVVKSIADSHLERTLIQDVWGVSFDEPKSVVNFTQERAQEILISMWAHCMQVMMSPVLCGNKFILAAAKSSMMFFPSLRKLLGMSFMLLVESHGMSSLGYWEKNLLRDVEIVSVSLLGCCYEGKSAETAGKLLQYFQTCEKQRSHRIYSTFRSDIADRSNQASTHQSLQVLWRELEEFGISRSVLQQISGWYGGAFGSSESFSGVDDTTLLGTLRNVNSIWFQACVLLFCCQKGFMRRLSSAFEAELKRLAAAKPCDSAQYTEFCQTAVNFLSSSILFIDIVSHCSPEEWELYQTLCAESEISVSNSAEMAISTPICSDDWHVLNSLEAHIPSVRGTPHCAVSHIKNLLVLVATQHDAIEGPTPKRIVERQLSKFCHAIESAKGSERFHKLSIEIIETARVAPIDNISDSVPQETVYSPFREPLPQTSSSEIGDHCDDPVAPDDDSISREALEEIVPSTILVHSSESSSSAPQARNSTGQSSERSSDPGTRLTEMSPKGDNPPSGAIAYAVTSETFRALRAFGPTRVPKDGRPVEMSKVSPEGPNPRSVLRDLETPQLATKPSGGESEASFDTRILEQVTCIESIEDGIGERITPGTVDPVQSPVNSIENNNLNSVIPNEIPSDMSDIKAAFAEFGEALKAHFRTSRRSI
ncbi:glycosyl transferase group 1 [Perkinsela sp. CCAP 1560/4]|nr:glycosyl transferase group 1 [Perkinsela sp. CCAP 1560/4]|eukprot:KNH08209.1 glycosyl transferase group 1 [Perkinsela sp. CCAP 1560/4]